MPKEWVISPPWQQRDQLAQTLRVSPIFAQVLYNRGLTCEPDCRQFLDPQMGDIYQPELIPGTLEAADRIVAAARAGRKIVIYGDYDVDGITASAILWHCLKLAGANVDYYVPHRIDEGYGVNADAIDALAADGADLIITVDCGVTAVEPALRARNHGVEFIITDHHQPLLGIDHQPILPEAIIVHPSLSRASHAAYPNPDLCGAGVALKLAWAIAQKLSNAKKVLPEFRAFLVDAMSLAALGTIADVVSLKGENRIIACHGLRGLAQSRLPGLQALIESAGLKGRALSGYDIGFKLAPRLNAIGRMGHARLAVEMLTRANADEAAVIAANLHQQNLARQRLQNRIAKEAREMVIASGQDHEDARGIVLASSEWHAGVIGIVASKIVEEFGRPTVMIALDNGVGQGSGRSVRNFALHEAFAACREHLLTFGGHAMAAGLRISADYVDSFRDAFQAYAGRQLTPQDLRPKMNIDDVVGLGDLNMQLVGDMARLEPFGAGNAPPWLATDWLNLHGDPRTVGTGSAHLQVTLTDGRHQCKGIAFGMARYAAELADHRRCRVAFQPVVNEWQGRRSIEMQIVDFQFPN